MDDRQDAICGDLRSGSVLVLVLIVVSSMGVMAAGLAYRSRLEIRMTTSYVEQMRDHYLALGGVARVRSYMYELEQRAQIEGISEAAVTRLAAQLRGGAQSEAAFEALDDYPFEVETDVGYALVDESGFLNVNRSDSAVWEKLTPVDRSLRAALLDWIDTDDDQSPEGAEGDFYARRLGWLGAKNAPLELLSEIRLVRDVDRRRYQGNVQRQTGLILDEEEMDDETPGLVDLFTVYGEGRVNINTVPETILAALPGIDEQIAQAIVQYRDGMPYGDVLAFEEAADFEDPDFMRLTGLSETQIALLGEYVSFTSQHFRVYTRVRHGDGTGATLVGTFSHTSDEGLRLLHLEKVQ